TLDQTRSAQRVVRGRLAAIRRQPKADRLATVGQLAEGQDPWAEIILLHLLDDPSGDVRERAVDALWSLGGTLARIGARAALGDPEWSVRDTAAEALGEIGNRQDIPRLVALLQDPQWAVRASAAGGLGTLGDKRAKQALIKALTEDSHRAVRRYAAVALGALRDEAAISILTESLSLEEDHHVLTGVLHGLYILGQRERLGQLLSLLESDDPLVRSQVLSFVERDIHPEDRGGATLALRQSLERENNAG